MSGQPVESGEGGVAGVEALAHKRLLLRVDPDREILNIWLLCTVAVNVKICCQTYRVPTYSCFSSSSPSSPPPSSAIKSIINKTSIFP